jgi:hypothetical protein
MAQITELRRRPDRKFNGGGLPRFHEGPGRHTKEEAYDDAVAWAQRYRASNPIARSAYALGVVYDGPAAGWRGIVNYYHSNS